MRVISTNFFHRMDFLFLQSLLESILGTTVNFECTQTRVVFLNDKN